MHVNHLGSLLIVTAFVCSGCGPLHMPMPVRLEPDEQAQVDDAWNRAVAPADRLSDQELLDALLTSQAYQIGVDALFFRSEKRLATGVVVMEIQYDRLRPESDSFTVTVLDNAGVVQRQEGYSRAQVCETYRVLFIETAQLEDKAQHGALSADERQRFEELKARQAVVSGLFPTFERHDPESSS